MEENYKEIEIRKYKKLIEIITAYLQGDQIQYKLSNNWKNIDDIKYIDFINVDFYRIKPKFRPCKNAKEFTKVLYDHRYNTVIKNTITKNTESIESYNDNHIYLSLSGEKTYEELFYNFVFNVDPYDKGKIGILEE